MKLIIAMLLLGIFTVSPAHATGCSSNLDCKIFPGSCENGFCVNECTFDSDCGSGMQCDRDVGGTCTGGSFGDPKDCRANYDCPFPQDCVNGLCRGH